MTDYKIADISLATMGRNQLAIVENDMAGMMKLRQQYASKQILKGARISGCVHMTYQTAVLIESLVACGAEVRWCSCSPLSTDDAAAAAIAAAGIAVFAWKYETKEEFEWCKEQALKFGDKGPNVVLDDVGDLTDMLHEKYPEMLDSIKGIAEQTTTGVTRLYKLFEKGKLKVPSICVNDSVTKSNFDNIYGMRESSIDGIRRAINTTIAGKVCIVCGYGQVGKGCAQCFRSLGGRVIVTEIDPINALQASLDGFEVDTLEGCIEEADIVITAVGCVKILTGEYIARAKNNAILCNVGAFDADIDIKWIRENAVSHTKIKTQVDKYSFKNGKSITLLAEAQLVNLVCGSGHPSFVMSTTFSNMFLAAVDIYTSSYKDDPINIYTLPKKIDEEVAKNHLESLGGKLTKLTKEQADNLGVTIDGPYKRENYAY